MHSKLKVSSILLFITIALTPIAAFNNIDNKKISLPNNIEYRNNISYKDKDFKPKPIFKDALPYDFFGDYSYPEF